MILPITFAVLIALAHYWSTKLCVLCARFRDIIIPLVAGISTVYVFVNLYPEFYREATSVSPFIFTSVFLGFAAFHVIDKEIYQKTKRYRSYYDIEIAHGIGLAVYYFVVGIVLVRLFDISNHEGVLFFIPLFIYAGLSTLTLYGLKGMNSRHKKELTHLDMFQGLCLVAGTSVALFFKIPEFCLLYMIGLVAGILTYVVIRDILPKGRKGGPFYFVLGAMIYLALIIGLWYI